MFEKKNSTSTVRVVNIDPRATEPELRAAFEIALPRSILKTSLAKSNPDHDAVQTATITFKDDKDARKALALDGATLASCRLGVDVDFLGLTILASPPEAAVEYYSCFTCFFPRSFDLVYANLTSGPWTAS